MKRAFHVVRFLGQWTLVVALGLVALGLVGGTLSFFHHPAPILLDFGILALPAFFVALVFLFMAALFERLLARRSSQP